MGLLTDPNTGHGKLTKFLTSNGGKIHTFLYLAGVVWFFCLSHRLFNNGTYFSENALLPGLVRGQFDEDMAAKMYYMELNQVMQSYPDSIPYDWLVHKFAEINIEAHFHNFSLEYPFLKNTVYHGKNLYAVLRASRSSSIEGIVVTAPFRTLASAHPDNTASIALMLSLAKFCRKHKYWAKDIVFLIADHEQLGTQAWLEAYHNVKLGSGILKHGTLTTRAGSIQAAVNLELHSPKISHIDVKVEGVNGQLPNLDLFNLVHTLCAKEGIRHTFKNRTNPRKRDSPFDQWVHSTTTMLSMVLTQASCVPNGNHGLYHRFGIEALTLEGYKPPDNYRHQVAGFYQAGRVLEGVLRSLNNLLERFHQSYFFYLLPSNERFVSIGLYMPATCLIGAPLLIRAFIIWLQIYSQIKPKKEDVPEEASAQGDFKPKPKPVEKKPEKRSSFQFVNIGTVLLTAQAFGWLFVKSGVWLSNTGSEALGLESHISIYTGYVIYFIMSITIPCFFKLGATECNLLNIIALLETVTLFVTIAMHNFSLSLILCTVYVPVFVTITINSRRVKKIFYSLLMFLIHPFVLVHVIVLIYTYMTQGKEDLLSKAWAATQHSFIYFNIDNLIYGNWFIDAIFGFLVPSWVLFWNLLISNSR
ncbi:UNVERIFIED_CONTAM: hypothetical protein PYX00_004390 [Menopon gallinae]|uniref:Glycosylphosphatidylinositol anchor attachment 1 protein n=1 Tax=Menopon gallinae TaxID=328185 RepID=A0AAW2I5D8_9NEOP